MDYEGVTSVVCDGEENDWLDVSYAQRNYVQQTKKARFAPKKAIKVAVIAFMCVALLTATLFIDSDFSKDIFATVKQAYNSVLSVFSPKDNGTVTVFIPANANLVNVQDGVATFDGGRATLSFTEGSVSAVTENSVTVAIDEQTTVTYGGLTTVYVAVGDALSAGTLLGKYEGSFTASFANNGMPVTEVVGSAQQLTWQV